MNFVKIPGKRIEMTDAPITVADYCEFLNATNHELIEDHSQIMVVEKADVKYLPRKGKSNQPIVQVSWYDAKAFAEWAGGRLPKSEEWEYAASEDGKNEWSGTSNEDDLAEYAVYKQTNITDVKTKKPNGYGLFDMSGLVWEWTNDEWNKK